MSNEETLTDPVSEHAGVPTEEDPNPIQQTHQELAVETAQKAADVAADAKEVAQTLAKDTHDKATVLAAATDILSNRVASLSKVVQTNNLEILKMRKELDRKPDDAEVQLISGLAHQERWRHFRLAITIGMVSAFVAGTTSFTVSNNLSKARCVAIDNQSRTLIALLSKFDADKSNENIQSAIAELDRDKVEC